MPKNKKGSCRELKLAVGAQPDSSYNVDAIRKSVKVSNAETSKIIEHFHSAFFRQGSYRNHQRIKLYWCQPRGELITIGAEIVN